MCDQETHYARCLYDFASIEPGDLELKVGQVVKIKEWVDDQWIRGETIGQTPQTGIFPANYAHVFRLPNYSKDETPFVAIENFLDVLDDSNLRFRKGDIIIGTHDMGKGWWYGRLNVTHGTFLRDCVEPLVECQEDLKIEAKAIIDNKGQIDGELSFSCGDTIWITKVTDDIFCEGWCGDNYGMFPLDSVNIIDNVNFQNLCPNHQTSQSSNNDSADTSVVSINERNKRNRESMLSQNRMSISSEASQSNTRPKLGSFTSENMSTADEEVQAYATAIAPFVGQNVDELTFMAGDIVRLIQHIDHQWSLGEVTTSQGTRRGMFPSQFVEIIVDCQRASQESTDNSHPMYDGGDLESDCEHIYVDAQDPLAGIELTALYEFNGERADDLRFKAGERLTIIRSIDTNWYQAKNSEGDVGQCPKIYLSTPEEKNKSNGKPALPPKPDKSKINLTKDTTKQEVFTRKWSKKDKLDDIIANEIHQASRNKRMNRADAGYRPISTILVQSDSTDCTDSSKVAPKSRPLSCSISNQMLTDNTTTTNNNNNERKLSKGSQLAETKNIKKPPPPRPQLPKSLSTQSSENKVISDVSNDVYEPIPRRPAPPRPLPIIPNGSTETDDVSRSRADSQESTGSIYSTMSRPVLARMQSSSSLTRGQKNTSAVGDIHKRIRSIELEIQRNEEDIESIKRRVITQPEEGTDKGKTLQFCTENVKNLQNELIHLRGVLSQVRSSNNSLNRDSDMTDEQIDNIYDIVEGEYEDLDKLREVNETAAKEKRHNKRSNVIKELLDTEVAYLKDLDAIIYAYDKEKMKNKINPSDQDIIFSNIQDIACLSLTFKNAVQSAVDERGTADALIGHCFLSLLEDFQRCYVEYCTNHDDTIKLLSKEDRPDLDAFENEGLTRMRAECQINPMNLATMLIKPVQRLLKYPLLLNGILSSTEDDHPDKEKLQEAISEMINVASIVNEHKRRKELTTKYVWGITDNQRNVLRGFKKYTGRFSQLLHNKIIGAGCTTSDPEFDKEESQFNQLRKNVKILIKDARLSRDALKDMMEKQSILALSVYDVVQDRSHELGKEIDQYRTACDEALEIFKNRYWIFVENRVVGPLEKLIPLLEGPIRLIKKRKDKLLDYNKLELAAKKTKESGNMPRNLTEELIEAEKIYQAMNDQLKEELPLLNKMICNLFKECVFNYIQAMKDFSDSVLNKLVPLLEIYSHESHGGLKGNLSVCLEGCVTHHARIIEDLSNMTVFSRPVSAATPTPTSASLTPNNTKDSHRFSTVGRHSISHVSMENFIQSDQQRNLLRQKYTADNLYVVIHPYKPTQPLELDLQDGDLVGVMKKCDPMGNSKRWMVDKGNREYGFVPSSILQNERAANEPVASSGMSPSGECTTHWYVDIGADDWFKHQTPDIKSPQPNNLALPHHKPRARSPRPARHTIGPASGTRILQNQQNLEELRTVPPLIQIEEKSDPSPISVGLAHDLRSVFSPPSYDHHTVQLPTSASSATSSRSQSPNLRHSYSKEPDLGRASSYGNNYVALYKFDARNSNEMSILPGETLYVLQRHDHSFNPEWWMVSNGIKQGYVPANYLSRKV